MLRRIPPHEIDLLRARANQAHVTAQDVEELWQFVDAPPPEEATDTRHAGIIGDLEHGFGELVEPDERVEQSLCVGHHRAELDQGERPASHTGASLYVE